MLLTSSIVLSKVIAVMKERCPEPWDLLHAQKLQPCPVCQQQQPWQEDGLESDFAEEGVNGGSGRVGRSRRTSGAKPRRPMSQEHRENIRAALAGRKRRPLDEDHKRCSLLKSPVCWRQD